MPIQSLFTYNNLILAWRRITTAQNQQYKKIFRPLYYAYEIAIERNIKDLCARLLAGSFQPHSSVRIFLPKPSGLQRPLSLMYLEDQIVLQAIANLYEKKLRKKRLPFQFKYVFSNLLSCETNNIFFLRDWHIAYNRFQKRIEKIFKSGFRWVAFFDLAAFYDTISHELLIQTLFPKKGSDEVKKQIANLLKHWSSEKLNNSYSHGIPQGPMASDFLAECFMLTIDEKMSEEYEYLRYVDDIRLFGKSALEVRRAVVKLERLCRNCGLIPHSSKFDIREMTSVDEIIKVFPSFPPTDDENHENYSRLPDNETIGLLSEALNEEKTKVYDKSKFRYILFHSEPSQRMINQIIKLFSNHPEHIDAFMYYFDFFPQNTSILKIVLLSLRESPYEHVQGESWHFLSRRFGQLNKSQQDTLVKEAITELTSSKSGFLIKWGAGHFLCVAERKSAKKYANLIMYQKDALLQALLVPSIPENRYGKSDKLINSLFERSNFEPSLMTTEAIGLRGTNIYKALINKKLNTPTGNTFQALGITEDNKSKIDHIGDILTKRYQVQKWKKWKEIFGNEYDHALQILRAGDAVYDSGRDTWIGHQNSFNHILFLRLNLILKKNNHPGTINVTTEKGKDLFFGVLLDGNNSFSKHFESIANAFRALNSRRNTIPVYHPYNQRLGGNTKSLRQKERNQLHKLLAIAYNNIISVGSGTF